MPATVATSSQVPGQPCAANPIAPTVVITISSMILRLQDLDVVAARLGAALPPAAAPAASAAADDVPRSRTPDAVTL